MAEKLEDLNFPNAVVARLIKEALPDNVMVGKEARVALGRAASVFVLYVTSAASNVAKKGNRKTITGQDVLDAMGDLEFEHFIEPLQKYAENFKDMKKKKKESKNKETEAVAEPEGEAEPEEENGVEDVEMEDEEEES